MVPTQPHLNFGTDGSQIYADSEYLGPAFVSNELATAALSWIVMISLAFLLDTLQLMLTSAILIFNQALSNLATTQCSMNVGFIRHGDRQQHNYSMTWEQPSHMHNRTCLCHLSHLRHYPLQTRNYYPHPRRTSHYISSFQYTSASTPNPNR
jgi:hypothetical protein